MYPCLEVCTVVTFDHGRLEVNGQVLFKPGNNVPVRCDRPYAPVSPTITCQNTRHWIPEPSCTDIKCTVPQPVNGQFLFNNEVITAGQLLAMGSVIHLKCSPGSTSGANTSQTCLISTEWTVPQSTCTIITCSSLPPTFENGTYDAGQHSQPFQYNQTIRPLCNNGFYLQHGDIRQCIETDSWSGVDPLCSAITCNEPSMFSHGHYNSTETIYAYNSVLVPTCDTGYFIANNVTKRICLTNDTWYGNNPVCTIIQCAEPSVENGFVNSNITLYNYTMGIAIECHKGFELKLGSNTRTCDENGRWGTEPLKCEETRSGESRSQVVVVVGGIGGSLVAVGVAVGVILYIIIR